jgi:pentatricopeptide repeat protein
MRKAEHCFSKMISTGTIIPDEAAYCSIIDGYVMRKDLNQVLEWLIRMLDTGTCFVLEF